MRNLVAGLALILTNVCGASTVGQATIDVMVVQPNGMVYLKTTPAPLDSPSCATHVAEWHYAFDGTTAAGKNIYATLISAYFLAEEVRIIGTSDCDPDIDDTVESLDKLRLQGLTL